jgi:gluconolactonase
MTLEVRDPRLRAVVDPEVRIERLATGFEFTEGPIWHPREQHLIFSDMPGDHMRRWRPGEGVATFRKPSNMANGNAYDRSGRIVTCEHATSRLTRTGPDGRIEVLASHWQGKELNSPNDVVVKSDGWIYFSDPTFGRMEYYGLPREPELTFRGVYRVLPETGTIELLAQDFGQPNGLCFDLEERQLFVNDTERGHIRVFEVQADGRLGGSRVWAAPAGEGEGAPDGMKIDAAGNLFCTGPGGIHVFAPDAACLGVIRLPEVAANFTWGDPDLCGLFVCASTSLYRVRLRAPGRRAF